jgi:hypothetical protein
MLVISVVTAGASGCVRKRPPSAADAGPGEIVTPGGYVSPGAVKKQVEGILEKEHEKTLAPVVE